jgi:hypothetical protein
MTASQNSEGIILRSEQGIMTQLTDFESKLVEFLEYCKLPSQSVLVPVKERIRVFSNVLSVLDKVEDDQRGRSMYISKFIAAASSGLFDAALNYLWDETIIELRRRVVQYDLNYFYDTAVRSAEKRKHLRDADDLDKIDDAELIYGAHEIELISDLGFKHLDYVRYMRNWVSAAHPNHNELTGLQLSSMLETCIIEVISLPLSSVAVEIKRLLSNIKTTSISEEEAKQISSFFRNLTRDQINSLVSGFFGIYVRNDTLSPTRQNVQRLLPNLWPHVEEATRGQLGVRYGKYVANNDQDEARMSRAFLEVVGGLAYIPDGLRATEIQTAIDNLLSAHRNTNNFYNEPAFARQLQRLIGDLGDVPAQVNHSYVMGLVEVYLSNGNGVARNAEPIYISLINQFNEQQATLALMSFSDKIISSRLQHSLCAQKFRSLITLIEPKISTAVVKELIDDIKHFGGPLDKLSNDSRISGKISTMFTITGIKP